MVHTKTYNTYGFGGTFAVGVQFEYSEIISITFLLNDQIGFVDMKNYHSTYTFLNRNDMSFLHWGENKSSRPNALLYQNDLLSIKTGLIINL